MREFKPDRLRVSAWNFGDAREVGMRPWNLQAGIWRIEVSADGATVEPRETYIQRGMTVPIALPAQGEVEIALEVVEAEDWSSRRPDLALSATEGARIEDGTLTVIAHNIGSENAPACTATLSSGGEVIAEAQVPAVDPPLDFLPKTAEVSFDLPDGASGDMTIAIDTANAIEEITEVNNALNVHIN